MTDPTPYAAIVDSIGPCVIRGDDTIGGTRELRDAESFARELNALQSENARHIDLSERIKLALRQPGATGSYVEWAAECRAAYDDRDTLRARVAELEAVKKAARGVAEAWDADNGSGVLTDDIDDLVGDLNAALEATDGL